MLKKVRALPFLGCVPGRDFLLYPKAWLPLRDSELAATRLGWNRLLICWRFARWSGAFSRTGAQLWRGFVLGPEGWLKVRFSEVGPAGLGSDHIVDWS